MKTIFASIILAVLLPSLASAQALPLDKLTPPLQTPTERKVADAASWATALTLIALDTAASWRSDNRGRAFGTQAARIGVTYGAVFAVKQMVSRRRPCSYGLPGDPDVRGANYAESCGGDNPDYSFYSGHTAVAFQAVGGPRLAIALPLAISTSGLRVAGGKHYLTDTIVGAVAGLLTSRIR